MGQLGTGRHHTGSRVERNNVGTLIFLHSSRCILDAGAPPYLALTKNQISREEHTRDADAHTMPVLASEKYSMRESHPCAQRYPRRDRCPSILLLITSTRLVQPHGGLVTPGPAVSHPTGLHAACSRLMQIPRSHTLPPRPTPPASTVGRHQPQASLSGRRSGPGRRSTVAARPSRA